MSLKSDITTVVHRQNVKKDLECSPQTVMLQQSNIILKLRDGDRGRTPSHIRDETCHIYICMVTIRMTFHKTHTSSQPGRLSSQNKDQAT